MNADAGAGVSVAVIAGHRAHNLQPFRSALRLILPTTDLLESDIYIIQPAPPE